MINIKQILFLLIIFLYVLWPTNISWINDEPLLIQRALEANQQFELATIGLIGSKSIPFGAVPITIYQFLLLITANNLVLVIILKTICSALLIYYATFKICQRLSLNLWLAFLPLLSPFVFHYSRILWDNCFQIPISFLFLAILLEMLHKPRVLGTILLFSIATILFHVHLTSLMLTLPGITFLLFRQRNWATKNLFIILVSLAIILIISAPYLQTLWLSTLENKLSSSPWRSPYFIIFGFYYFSGMRFLESFIPEIFSSRFNTIAQVLVTINFLTLISCLVFGVLKILKERKVFKQEIFLLSIIIFSFGTIFALVTKIEAYTHYLNSLAPLYCLLIILAINNCLRFRLGRLLNYTYVTSLVLIIILFQSYIEIYGGNKSINYGATLANQISVLTEAKKFTPETKFYTTVKNYQLFPHAYQTLLRILPPANQNLIADSLWINYEEPESFSGKIELQKKGR